MIQTVFGTDRVSAQKRLRRELLLCAVTLCAAAVLHGVCVLARTEQNHNLLLIANIAIDLLAGGFLIPFLNLQVIPLQRLLRLYDAANRQMAGTVTEVGSDLTNYVGISCVEVRLPDRRLFLPADTAELTAGLHYSFRLKGNLIVEVRQCEQE